MQWTTYHTFKPDDITKGAAATLTALPNDGYRISLYTVDERVVDVNFYRAWSSNGSNNCVVLVGCFFHASLDEREDDMLFSCFVFAVVSSCSSAVHTQSAIQ